MQKFRSYNLAKVICLLLCTCCMILFGYGDGGIVQAAEHTLSSTPQTFDAYHTVDMDFTMKKNGYITIKFDGPVKIWLYDSEGNPAKSSRELREDSGYGITYSLAKGDYKLSFASDNEEKAYMVTVSAQFEYKIPSLSTKEKTYYGASGEEYYAKLKVKKAGYVVITTTNKSNGLTPVLYLCNSKNKVISNEIACTSVNGNGKYSFAVEKGTYYIKIKPRDSDSYTLKYKFTKCSDKKGKALKGGTSKKKAKTITIGKSVSGLVLVGDKASKKQWYKIVSNTPRNITLKITGNVSVSSNSTYGSMIKYKVTGPYSDISGFYHDVGYSQEYRFGVGPEPTYICITKTGKKTTGNYKITIK